MILITGGAGYIGSHTNKLLATRGYETLVYDSLIRGHKEFVKWGKLIQADLADTEALDRVFCEYPIDAVIHFAAFAYVGESMIAPAKYYNNNVVNTLHLLDAMRRHRCEKIIFSSSCATYGVPQSVPIYEDTPQNAINPYGRSKLMIEKIIIDYAAAYEIKYAILRYFNAAGNDPDCEIGEWHDPETHVIPLILQACAGVLSSFAVFGDDYDTPDGTCIRDYIHVCDLAKAHLLALQYFECNTDSINVNLGNQQGYSVKEIIRIAEEVTMRKIPVSIAARRPGDPAQLIGSNAKAKALLGWEPEYSDISMIIQHAWKWYGKVAGMRKKSD